MLAEMQRFKPTTESPPSLYSHSLFHLRGDDTNTTPNPTTRLTDSDLAVALVFQQQHYHHAFDLTSTSPPFTAKLNNVAVASSNLQYGTFNNNLASSGCYVETGQQQQQHHMFQQKGHFETRSESAMADNSQQTDDASTDIDTDDKTHCNNRAGNGELVVVDSNDQTKLKHEDQKTLRRLAQNREAARKSRLRKKAYVQQLENSRVRLAQLEQELQRARQQGVFAATGTVGDHARAVVGNGALAFDMDYARWVDEHQRLISDLRSAVNSQMGDNELNLLVDGVLAHHDELFRLKTIGAKADVFHILSGTWKTPAERCFMWLGGFRPSELLKIVRNHLEPLTDEQLMGIYNLQQSSQQAEDALSQGMEALHQSLSETLSSTSLGPTSSGNVAQYMGLMAIAMGKLATLENFLHQADLLRQQALQQLQRILVTHQAARALLVINDYISRLRALSSLWLACPKE